MPTPENRWEFLKKLNAHLYHAPGHSPQRNENLCPHNLDINYRQAYFWRLHAGNNPNVFQQKDEKQYAHTVDAAQLAEEPMLAPSAPSRFHRALERRAPANGRPTAAGRAGCRAGWDRKAWLGSAPARGGPGRHASDTVTDCSLGQHLFPLRRALRAGRCEETRSPLRTILTAS